jgi:DNA-binding beta-propeller fold protein YncE
MKPMRIWTIGLAVSTLALGFSAGAAQAQLAVSANDGKQPQLGQPPSDVKPDSVAVIDLGHYPPRTVGTVQVPVSMIGPPTSIAVSRDGGFAIVTASQKLDPADPTKFILDDKVSVIDLRDPAHPAVVQRLTAGAGATGVAINRAGTLALVASTGEGTISIYTIAGKRLTPAGKLQLDPAPGPVDVAISPDGKTALVTQRRGNSIWRLAIAGTNVTNTGIAYQTGGNPYGSVFSRDGKFAYNTNLLGNTLAPPPGTTPPGGGGGGGPPRIGTITVIDLTRNVVANTVEVGPTPEHVSISPNGKYIAVTVVNGSSANPTSANYNPFGLLRVYRIKGPLLAEVAQARTGRWGQGAAWSKDGRTILQQGAVAREIEVYRFDGKTLTRDMNATLHFDTRPGAISTALSR